MRDWVTRTAVCAVILGGGSARANADIADEGMAAEEVFWAARKAGDVKRVRDVLAPDYTSIESDCNGLRAMEGAGAAVKRLQEDLAEGAFGSYKLRRLSARVVGQAVVLTVGWQSRYAPRVGGVGAIRYTAGVATVVWAKGPGGAWKRYYYHSHWKATHTHAFGQAPKP